MISIKPFYKILTSISVWQNIDIDKAIMKNIDIVWEILENIDIDEILNRLEFAISNRASERTVIEICEYHNC